MQYAYKSLFGIGLMLFAMISLLSAVSVSSSTRLYVVNSAGVNVIDTSSNTVITTIMVGNSPSGIAINPTNTLVYVTNNADNTVSVINTTTDTVTKIISVDTGPGSVAFAPSGAFAYVTSYENHLVDVINVATGSMTQNIPITVGSCSQGNGPVAVAFAPSGSVAYVVKQCGNGGESSGDSSVAVISPSSNTVTATIGLLANAHPTSVAFNPAGTLAYITNQYEGSSASISVITVSSNSLSGAITGLDPWPTYSAFSQAGGIVYVATAFNPDMDVAPASGSGDLLTDFSVGGGPNSVVFSPSGALAYVSVGSTINVITVSSNSVTDTISLGGSPGDMAMGQVNNTLRATPSSPTLTNAIIDVGQVSIVNTVLAGGIGPYLGGWTVVSSNGVVGNNVTASVNVGGAPYAVAFNPQGTLAYIGNYGSAPSISVVNTITGGVVNTISASTDYITSIVFNPQGTKAYATGSPWGQVATISTATNSVVNTITAYTCGTCDVTTLAINPQGTLLYLTDGTGNLVKVISTSSNTVVNTIAVEDPLGITLNPQGTLAYATDLTDGIVDVINTTTNSITNTISLGSSSSPLGIAVNPQGTLAYATDTGTGSVSVINLATNTVVATISVGSSPSAVAFNPQGTIAYVTNSGSDTVSVINTATNSVIDTVNAGSYPNGVAFNPLGTLAYVTNLDSGTVNVMTPSETPIGSLPSSNAITLTINAISANTISFAFNGVTQQFTAPGMENIYGQLSLFGFGEDSTTGLGGLTGTNAIASSSNTLTINSQPSATGLTAGDLSVYGGQKVSYSVLISGGTGPFTVNLVATSNATVMNTVVEPSTGTVTFGSISGLPVGAYTFNVIATDTGTSTPFVFTASSSEVTVANPPTPQPFTGGLPPTTTLQPITTVSTTISTTTFNTTQSTTSLNSTTSTVIQPITTVQVPAGPTAPKMRWWQSFIQWLEDLFKGI